MKKIVLVTGGFDPLHSGHIQYFNEARKLGDILVVGLNSDNWLRRKKGREFMSLRERSEIVKNIVGVDFVISFDDANDHAQKAIWMVRQSYPQDRIIFANGGDRTIENIPEMDYHDDNIEFVFGIGGQDKKNSSSWLLDEWKAPKTERAWGYYRTLHEPNSHVKLKELTVDPGKSLSMQRHKDRAEFWFVSEGTASVYTVNQKTDYEPVGMFKEHQHIWISKESWHQLCNETSKPLKIIEIQYGENCIEEDIERK